MPFGAKSRVSIDQNEDLTANFVYISDNGDDSESLIHTTVYSSFTTPIILIFYNTTISIIIH